MVSDREAFERTYEKPNAIWTSEEPPEELVKLIESGKIKPCRVLDIGCGEGFYSIYLANRGFEVTGVDISGNAIRYAKKNAEKAGVSIRFIVMDATEIGSLSERFDFVFEWALLHSIMPEHRKAYSEAISQLLNDGGKYMSVCFNEKDPRFGGPSQGERKVPEGSRAIVGTSLYFSSLDELRALFSPIFRILESRTFENRAGGNVSVWNYLLMEKP